MIFLIFFCSFVCYNKGKIIIIIIFGQLLLVFPEDFLIRLNSFDLLFILLLCGDISNVIVVSFAHLCKFDKVSLRFGKSLLCLGCECWANCFGTVREKSWNKRFAVSKLSILEQPLLFGYVVKCQKVDF